jgi:hypothetical protein
VLANDQQNITNASIESTPSIHQSPSLPWLECAEADLSFNQLCTVDASIVSQKQKTTIFEISGITSSL